MDFDDTDMENEVDVNGTPPPEESSNRTFIIVAGSLGAIMLLTLICLALYAFYLAPRNRDRQATQVAEINAQNTQIAQAAEQTAQAARFTDTPEPTAIPTTTPTSSPTASPTLVVAAPTEVAATSTPDPRTATVAALLTQAAEAQQTITPTASGLPQTGFADEVGVPGLVGLSLVLIVVIFLARRLRTSGT
jgi:LPXTG-motif cell wall-anchored protein